MAGQPNRGLRILGVLGGVGSGKSTAARLLAVALSAPHLDADAEVDDLWADAAFRRLLCRDLSAAVGPVPLDPADPELRRHLGQLAFADPTIRKELERRLHPAVRKALWEGLAAAEATGGWAVLDVPLLVENGLVAICDYLVFVDTPAAQRAARAAARHGWTEADWQRREAAQAPLERKKSLAHAILENAGDVPDLKDRVDALVQAMPAVAPRPLRDRWPNPEGPPSC